MNLPNLAENPSGLNHFVLHWPPSMQFANQQFFDFCQLNSELLIERNVHGDCEIMAPTGGETGWRNLSLAAQLYNWAETDGSGVAFDSSTGFVLPNGAIRSPDVSWVKKSRLTALTPEQKQGFLPLCPDVVIELKSPSDSLQKLQDKMQEYVANGALLGWLIVPEKRQVWVFRAGEAAVVLDEPLRVSGEGVLQGFMLAVESLWQVGF